MTDEPSPLASRRRFLQGMLALGLLPPLAGLLEACSDDGGDSLSFLNWQDYVDPKILRRFEEQEGATVRYETYASNDELADRLQLAGVARRRGRKATTFDLIVPSDNLFRHLRDIDILQPLDRSIVTTGLLHNLSVPVRMATADPGNQYSIPWATGTTGIGYDTTVFPEPPGWDVFLDRRHAGKMTLLDEAREAFAAALLLLGEDPNTTEPAIIEAARLKLEAIKAVIDGFDSATYLDRLAGGGLVAAQAFNTDVLQAKERNPKLAFVIPEAGGTRWVDLLCIPDGAPNPDLANRFVAFYLGPPVSAANATYNRVDTGNSAAAPLVPASVRSDTDIYPTAAITARLHFLEDLGDAEALYNRAWKQLGR